ncbi:MAG: zinc ribbon domain-containing protein [Methanoregulaceae archaeon]
MSPKGQFCPGCGAPRTPGERFCGTSGARFESDIPASSETTANELMDTAVSTEHTVERAVTVAQEAANLAGQVSRFEIGPPAEWKVVVGDALPAGGETVVERASEAVVDRAVNAVTAEVKEAVTSGVQQAVQGVAGPVGGIPVSDAPRCPACGKETIPGKRFCGTCGAPLSPVPSPGVKPAFCQSCGDPIGPNEKFCGACGAPTR